MAISVQAAAADGLEIVEAGEDVLGGEVLELEGGVEGVDGVEDELLGVAVQAAGDVLDVGYGEGDGFGHGVLVWPAEAGTTNERQNGQFTLSCLHWVVAAVAFGRAVVAVGQGAGPEGPAAVSAVLAAGPGVEPADERLEELAGAAGPGLWDPEGATEAVLDGDEHGLILLFMARAMDDTGTAIGAPGKPHTRAIRQPLAPDENIVTAAALAVFLLVRILEQNRPALT
jgi:hypothetical protein